jgi:hypothetical protein
MKFIQTLFSFLSIYLFLSVIVFFITCSLWLSSYISSVPTQQVARVTVGVSEQSGSPFVYYNTASSNALLAAVSRGVQQPKKDETSVLSATSTVVIATFDKVTLHEVLVPVGFSSMYRLRSVTDASGQTLFEQKETLLDKLYFTVLSGYLKREQQHFSLFASDKEETYTISVKENELYVTKNEN